MKCQRANKTREILRLAERADKASFLQREVVAPRRNNVTKQDFLGLRDDPIVRRKVDLPEAGGGLNELDAHLRFIALQSTQVNNATFKRFVSGFIGYRYLLAGSDLRSKRNQSPMSVYNECAGILAEILTGGRLTSDDNLNAQQDAHAATAAAVSGPVLVFGVR